MKDNCGSGTLEINTPSCDSAPCVETCSSTPAPCPENHCIVEVKNQFCTTIKVMNAWNIPDCGEQAILEVPNVLSALPGSFLWSSTYGYFEIVTYNASTQQLTVQNNCNDGNLAPGTQVLACSEFIIVDEPFSSTDPTEFPYVAIDFTAPANGDCLDILVTSVIGLTAGGTIQIGSGIYVLNSIVSPTVINICNEGEGLIPGTVVVAQNLAGDYQYPISMIGANPCDNDIVEEGTLIVCDGVKAVPLGGSTVGSVPVLQDASSDIVSYEALSSVYFMDAAAISGAVPDTPSTLDSTHISRLLTNPSSTRAMHVLATYFLDIAPDSTVNYVGTLGDPKVLFFGINLRRKFDAGAYVNIKEYVDMIPGFVTAVPLNYNPSIFLFQEVITLAAGNATTLETYIETYVGAGGVADLTFDADSRIRVMFFGVPA